MRSKDMADDAAEMQQTRVGGAHQRRSEPDDCAKSQDSRASEPGLPSEGAIFDASKLHTQLADLLQIYLKRASQPDAIEKCSAKDAITCAKTLTAMMSDLQSGKPASVDADTEWPTVDTLLGCQGLGS